MSFRRLFNATKHQGATLLQVLPSLTAGGVERGTVDIAIAAKDAGYHSIVASEGGALVRHLESAGVTHVTLPLESKNPLTMLTNVTRLERVIAKYNVDIVHARSRAPAWSAYYAARNTGKHFLTTFHGTYGVKGWMKREYNSIMVRGERVIAISDFIAQHIRENYDVDWDRIVTIPRGVDLASFDPAKVPEQRLMRIINYLKIPSELPLILVPGRITRWKGQDFLLKALSRLPHRHFFCVLLGDDKRHPEYRGDLEEMIRELGLVGNVRIVPHTYDMPAAYFIASLIIAPSMEPEAFGRIAIEAQAMGKPIIATAHGGFQETILHNETGWLVAPGDVDALAEAIGHGLNLLHHPKRRKEMCEAAMAHARANYTLEAMKDATLRVYEEILSKPVNLPKRKKKAKAVLPKLRRERKPRKKKSKVSKAEAA